jgi:hypothetical protein
MIRETFSPGAFRGMQLCHWTEFTLLEINFVRAERILQGGMWRKGGSRE